MGLTIFLFAVCAFAFCAGTAERHDPPRAIGFYIVAAICMSLGMAGL